MLRLSSLICICLPFIGFIVTPLTTQADGPFFNVKCEGSYVHHLQGVTTNNKDAIYWDFTSTLIKTDAGGKLLKKIPVGIHHGDLCHHDRKIYVAVNFGKFNDPQKRADSWVYVYDAGDLSLLAKHKTPELVYGAGGMAVRDGQFFVIGGLPDDINENYIYEYDAKFKFVKRHILKSGHTHLGIQTAEYADGHWWFGCYGEPAIMLKASDDFSKVQRFELDCSLGITSVAKNTLLIAKGQCRGRCTGELLLTSPDEKKGLIPRTK